MRNAIFAMAVVALMGMLAAPALSKGNGKAKGSVRVDLTPRSANPDHDSSGWVVLNTTSDGIVKANVHIEGATPDTELAVILVVEGTWDEDNFMTIGNNGRGVGSDSEEIPLSLYGPDGVPLPPGTVTVRLAVRPAAGSSADVWTSATVELPLKTLDMQ